MNRTLEDEIRGALREGAANEDTRADWVRLAMANKTPPRRHLIRPLWPAMAAAVLLTVAFWPRAEQTDAPEPASIASREEKTVRKSTIDSERKKNIAFLEKYDGNALKKKSAWAVVAGGDTIHVADTPQEALAIADKKAPGAQHRFVFAVDGDEYKRGEVIGDRSPVEPVSVGIWFFQRAGIDAKDHKTIKLSINGRAITFRVAPKSMVPVLLPNDMHFPRFEIPGRMILEDMDRSWRSFRRYLVRVQCDDPKIDMWTEAIGGTKGENVAPGDWVAVRLGRHVFHALHGSPAEIAAKEDKTVLVLRFKKGATKYLNSLFEDTDLRGAAQHAVPNAERTVLMRYRKNGSLVEILPLPDESTKTRRALLASLAQK